MVFEVAFDHDVAPDFVQNATARSASPYGGQPDNVDNIPVQVVQRTPRIFRLTLSRHLSQPLYSLDFMTKDGARQTKLINNGGFLTTDSRRLDVGPTDAMGDVPVNGLLWLQAHTRLNPFTVNPRVTTGGQTVRLVTEFVDDGTLVLLRPVGLLRSDTTYTVELKGLEDLAGRPLPDRTWTFHTAPGPDFSTTRLISYSPKGSAAVTVKPQVTFSKPVYFLRELWPLTRGVLDDFQLNLTGAQVRGDIEVTPDGRTFTFVPSRPWPVDSAIVLPVSSGRYVDWTGAPADVSLLPTGAGSPSYSTPFSTTSATGAAPSVSLRNPQPDAVDVPRNVRIRARFFNGLLASSLSGITLTTGGEAVPMQASLADDGVTLSISPLQLLDANRVYTVNLPGLLSSDGIASDPAEKWSFTTSSLASAIPPAPRIYAVRTDPFSFRVLLARPVDPIALGTGAVRVFFNQYPVAFDLVVEDAGKALRLFPRAPLLATGTWDVRTPGLLDEAGSPFPEAFASFSASLPDFSGPPELLSVLPVPGSTVQVNLQPALAFDRPVSIRPGSAGVRLSVNGIPQLIRLTGEATNTLIITPMADLPPGAICQLDIEGLMDASGNEAAPLSWSFTIAADGRTDTTLLRRISISPPVNAVGVPAHTPIIAEFSRPVTLQAATGGTSAPLSPAQPYRFRILSEKNQVVLEPVTTWISGTIISVQYTVRDIIGLTSTVYTSFTTAASEDKTPPTLESILPEPGSKLNAGNTEFRLRFNEPVTTSAQFANLSCNGTRLWNTQVTVPTQGDGRTVIVTTTLPGSATCTLNLTSDLTDLSGNRFLPVVYEYSVAADDSAGGPTILSVQPADGATNVPLDAAITLRFNHPMNEASLAGALRVYNDGYLAQVTLTPDANNQVWTIVPTANWRPNSNVRVTVGTTAYSLSGLAFSYAYSANFFTLSPEATPTSGASLAALRATPEFIDLRFSTPVDNPPGEPFGLRQGQTRIPVVIDRMGPAWFRLTPGTPLDTASQYTLMAGPGLEVPVRLAPPEPATPTGAPQVTRDESGQISLRFDTPIHAFSIDATTLVLLDRQGNPTPHTARVSPDGRVVWIEPLGSQPPSALLWHGRRLPVPPAP
jgi:methionine-rich copper-binding protein CopC